MVGGYEAVSARVGEPLVGSRKITDKRGRGQAPPLRKAKVGSLELLT